LLSRFERTVDPIDLPDDEAEMAKLIETAVKPIMRGTSATGLVGNGQEVALAREVISEKESLDTTEFKREKIWFCPDCSEAI
jgi:hypothetical protein